MPSFSIPEKLERILTTSARIIVILGGRGSAKSETVARVLLMKAQTEAADILCGREYQNSIDDSVHKLLKTLIPKMGVTGFEVTDKKIDCVTGGGFRFKGFSRNPEAVKSAQDFKYSWVEEADSISQQSIDDLIPTIRAAGSKLFFTANPQASNDPFSKRFIVPYLPDLQKQGWYEDDMHLILMMNWRDNPWFPPELEQLRQWSFANNTRAKHDHIWEGHFNDSVDDALVKAEWFDACLDAHKVLGIKPIGMLIAAHDPSDEGGDTKGYACRHGSIIHDVQEKTSGNVNEGCDWATGLAINARVDAFTWDCDGMGVSLNRQVTTAFEGKHTRIAQFKGSEGVDFPDRIFEPTEGAYVQDQKLNKHALKNKRAQYYLELRKRMYNTYQAVINKVYTDPEKILSFDTEKIDKGVMTKLRSELCRIPVKPNGNGLFELYTKAEMKSKFKMDSPNLADSVMMLMRQPHKAEAAVTRPQPIRPIGRR
ncbi:MAG: PBSX family phage terminase large subunit [Desulfobulbaceae bacterium]|nr:PBSX family phage terminase large subunit [Desulfobulbaceae bacterium]